MRRKTIETRRRGAQPLLFFILLFLLFLNGCAKTTGTPAGRQVNLYVWSNYIPESALRDFQRSTGILLNYDTYDSNEALLEKMQSGLSEYDVIVPSDYMIGILRRQNLLQPLNHSRIQNIRNISGRFLNAVYDPGNIYSVPFLWSTTGIGYNKTKVTDVVDSWAILWNPKYAGRTLMLDDMRECFSAALKWKHHSINSTNLADINEAKQLLLMQKPLLKAYNSTNFDDVLLAGDVWITHAWSGQIAQVAAQNPDLAYVIPEEGGVLAVENLAIPKSAPHKDEAHILINWLLDAHVGAKITNLSRYPNSNEAAKRFIDPAILNNSMIYPDEATLERCELVADIGPVYEVLDRYWTEIKSR